VNNSVTTARVLICLLAAIPSIAGYCAVIWHDRFPPGSLRKFGLVLFLMLLIPTTVLGQFYINGVLGHLSKRDELVTFLVPTQNLIAAAVIFVSYVRRERAKRSKK
jgi:hypothetical protein